MAHKQNNAVLLDNTEIAESNDVESIDENMLSEYKTLNDKFEQVILKIKNRKARKKTKI